MWRRRARRPIVQGAQPSPRRVVGPIFRHSCSAAAWNVVPGHTVAPRERGKQGVISYEPSTADRPLTDAARTALIATIATGIGLVFILRLAATRLPLTATERLRRGRSLTGMTPPTKTIRWLIIGFVIVEAALIGWALLSGRIH